MILFCTLIQQYDNVTHIILENKYSFIFTNYLRKNKYKLERRGLNEEQEQRNKETGNS